MSIIGKVFLLLAAVIAIGLIVYQKQISQFFFAPEGLSLAASEICLQNQTEQNLVVDISVQGGERMVVLLVPQEQGCAASPEISRKGLIKVGMNEKEGPFCRLEAVSGQKLKLNRFSVEDNCGWPK